VERVHPRLIRDSPENLFAQCDQNWIGLGQTGAINHQEIYGVAQRAFQVCTSGTLLRFCL
jgi:hypothetical protein